MWKKFVEKKLWKKKNYEKLMLKCVKTFLSYKSFKIHLETTKKPYKNFSFLFYFFSHHYKDGTIKNTKCSKKSKQNLKGRKHPLRPKKEETERCDEYFKDWKR